MARTVPHLPHLSVPHPAPSPADERMHTYGTAHHRLDALAWAALLLGIASFAIAGAVHGSVVGVVLGAIGFAVAAVAQMLSATTAERWLIIPGWALSFVGALLNLFFLYN